MKEKRDILKKFVNEESLTMADSHELDQLLDASEPLGVAMRELSDDEPSLAWRSSLNERLIAMHAPRRSRGRLWGMARLGTAVAVTASIVFMAKPAETTAPSSLQSSSSSAEQILLDAHRMNVFALSTGAGDGSEPIQAQTSTVPHEWTEADLGSF